MFAPLIDTEPSALSVMVDPVVRMTVSPAGEIMIFGGSACAATPIPNNDKNANADRMMVPCGVPHTIGTRNCKRCQTVGDGG